MIAVFSGTGNSMYIARRLSDRLGDKIVALPTADCDAVPDNGRVVWVFPVYSWGVPPVMADIIRTIKIPGGDGCRHFLVVTCGDDIGNTHIQWRRLINARGWKATDAWSVQMPNTYVLMKGFDVDSDHLAEEKIRLAGPRTDSIAHIISQRTVANESDLINDVVKGSFAWLKSAVVYPWFRRFAMSPRPFFADGDCIGCGKCSSSCPLGNIVMNDGVPKWNDHCALCLRCYHICPVKAVSYSTATIGKHQKRQLTELVTKSGK